MVSCRKTTAIGQAYVILVVAIALAIVPGGAKADRFVRSNAVEREPIVEDKITGLMWQGCVMGMAGESCGGGAVSELDWEKALEHCEASEWGGYDNWRLPNINELRSIVNNHFVDPSIDVDIFPETPSESYWSSSSLAYDVSQAWFVSFYYGGDYFDYKKGDGIHRPFYVRCVRDLP